MQVNDGHFEGVGGLRLYYKIWQPEETPQGVMAIVHGAGEHIDRYQNFVDLLVPAGYALAGYDLRGHGRSEGLRGHINSWDEYRDDQERFLKLARELFPGSPITLYGHSMGSLIALDYLQHNSQGLSSAIISGTALFPKDAAPPSQVMIAKILTGIVPRYTLKMKLEGASLSRDPNVARGYMEDPLVFWDRTVRWGAEGLKTIDRIKSRVDKIDLPVLFLHGECDPLVSVEGARQFFEQIRHPDKTLHVYPDCLHEPHNELIYKQVVTDIQEWLDRHH